jgi:hypothetical protein
MWLVCQLCAAALNCSAMLSIVEPHSTTAVQDVHSGMCMHPQAVITAQHPHKSCYLTESVHVLHVAFMVFLDHRLGPCWQI